MKLSPEELEKLKFSEEVINNIPPYSLEYMNRILDAYTLEDFFKIDEEFINKYKLPIDMKVSNDMKLIKLKLPCVLLLLPDDESKSGHYIALAQNKDKNILYYFDSFGYNPLKLWEEHPQMMGEKQNIDKWGEFLKQYDKVIFNDKKLQSDNSNICGCYCITYIYEFNSRSIDLTPEIFASLIIKTKDNYNLLSYDNALMIYYLKVITDLNLWYEEFNKNKKDFN